MMEVASFPGSPRTRTKRRKEGESLVKFRLSNNNKTQKESIYEGFILARSKALRAFVACGTKFAQRAWARSSRDVCHSRIFTSPGRCRVAYIHVQWSFKLKQVKRIR